MVILQPKLQKSLQNSMLFATFATQSKRSVTAQSGHWSHFFSIAPAGADHHKYTLAQLDQHTIIYTTVR